MTLPPGFAKLLMKPLPIGSTTPVNTMIYKYIIKNVARRHGKTVTVMPKPIFQDNGSGMHTHQSLWKRGKNVFYNAKNYALISDTARHYIGGTKMAL